MRARLLALLSIAAACGGSEPPVEPVFSSIQRRIFNVSCVFSSCHSSRGRKGNLVLEPGESYRNLVGVLADNEAARAAGKRRVVPGNALASFLWQKIDQNTLGIDEGDPMPAVGDRLPQQRIDAIRQWIEAGAIDDTAPPDAGVPDAGVPDAGVPGGPADAGGAPDGGAGGG